MKQKLFALMLLLPFVFSPLSVAEEETAEQLDEVRYIELTPAFVTNFGGPGRLKYIKTEVSLRVDSQQAYRAVMHHVPTLRHSIIMVLNRQTDDSVDTMAGKEQIRMETLSSLQEVMREEEGEALIEDVLFSSFFVQR